MRLTVAGDTSTSQQFSSPVWRWRCHVLTDVHLAGGNGGRDRATYPYLLRGTVRLELGDDEHELAPGDSIRYWSSTPHRISNADDEPAEVMWIISPPSY